MSIISEALKKAQNRNEQAKRLNVTHKSPLIEIKSKAPKAKTKMRPFLTIITMLALFILVFIAFKPATEIIKSVNTQRPRTADYKVLNRMTSYIDIEKKRNPQSFELSGIVFGGGEPSAIINNEIFEKGDRCEGGEVVSIEKNKVTLLFDDEKITLILE